MSLFTHDQRQQVEHTHTQKKKKTIPYSNNHPLPSINLHLLPEHRATLPYRKSKAAPPAPPLFAEKMLFQGIVSYPYSIPLKSETPRSVRTTFSSSSQLPSSVQFSIPDSVLASRGFNLHRSFTSLNIDDLNTVFVRVGFPRRDPAKILTALQHSSTLLWIEHAKTQKPVAFARTTGDGVFNAVIWDVVVDPSYQGFGLGKAVMERLVEQQLQTGITNIALYAEPRVVGFYRALGFAADPDGIRGMVYSRKQQKKRR